MSGSIPLKITILGCGTSTGVPVIGCDCAVCSSPHPYNQRLRSSILVTRLDKKEGELANLVIDVTPDFRAQMLREKVKSLQHVLFTHMHADHCHGFDDLRAFYFHSQQAVCCYLAPGDLQELKIRFHYAFEDTGYLGTSPQIDTYPIGDKEFEVLGLTIDPLLLPHGSVQTLAFRIGNFAYATDFKHFPPEAITRWKGKIDTMVASGLRFRPHLTHSSVEETIQLFYDLGVRRGIITHLSHEVEYERDSKKLPPHVEFAFDGKVFDHDYRCP